MENQVGGSLLDGEFRCWSWFSCWVTGWIRLKSRKAPR